MTTATKDEFFNPTKLSSRDKAAATDHMARSIIASEVSEREKKTERLRLLRLEKEASEPPVAKPVKKTRKASASH